MGSQTTRVPRWGHVFLGAVVAVSVSVVSCVVGCVNIGDVGADVGVIGPAARDQVYNDACAVDADCVIGAYAACFCGSCGDIAMNASEQARFNDNNVVSGCPEGPSPTCGACAPVRAVCQEGSCVLEICPNEDCDA